MFLFVRVSATRHRYTAMKCDEVNRGYLIILDHVVSKLLAAVGANLYGKPALFIPFLAISQKILRIISWS